MKNIFVCKHCGSANVTKHLITNINTPEVLLKAKTFCNLCNAVDSIIHVEVPDDFDDAHGFYKQKEKEHKLQKFQIELANLVKLCAIDAATNTPSSVVAEEIVEYIKKLHP
jgi:hypothetical protein